MSGVEGVIVQRVMPPGEVGWCHQCGTLQLLEDAPWLDLDWLRTPMGGVPPMLDVPAQPCCVRCRESEPWELGVWPVDESLRNCAMQLHETWSPDRCEQCEVEEGRDGGDNARSA